MTFTLKEHTADIAVEATGDSLDAVFADVAAGLTAAHCESVPDPETVDAERFPIGLQAESKEALLFDYLDELIYERDVRNVLPAHHEATVNWNGTWALEAYAYGIPLDAVSAREIKAVTYSEMELEETSEGWRAYVVFDV
ncbi:archease [Natronomonas sp.]|uniref:archease n=1 Tax=Natronomonas sp. TaxID=2184060 RepID=UPI002FC2AC51